jgi:rhodanese-related sulfurtransferase
LGSGIVGGLLFGVGFVVGGYCPGTALVSAATLKLDGLLFVLGVLGGIFVFGYTEPAIDGFFNDSGNFGRWTLEEWLGLPLPVVVLLVVLLALTFFAGGEWVERWMNRSRDATNPRKFRPVYGLAAALVGTTVLLTLLWPLTNRLRDHATIAKVEASIAHRQIHVEARELTDLMRDRKLSVSLIDLRDEASYNRFHLLDARRLLGDVSSVARLPSKTVKVLLADDESTEVTAYRKLALARVENLYVLAGGLPAWTALFEPTALPVEQLAALGGAHPFSRPPLQTASGASSYVAKVKRPGMGAKKAGGGCGG